ncbi:unannotated protein [freshwater metagenome]|uniref:Unannotated protein n=1 Tax=freshwater metagenome TaxID=449393 RepID=A0A6J6EFA5_9ZZZZ
MRGIHDLGTSGDSCDRHAAADSLGAGDEVGLNPEVFARKICAGAGHATLHLIGDIHNAIRPTPIDEGVEVALGGNNEPTLTLNRLDKEAGDLASTDSLFQVGNGALSGLRTRETIVKRRRVWRVVHRTREWAKACSVGVHVVVHGRCEVGPAVIAVVQDRDLGATGVFARNLHGVLDGFSSGVDQNRFLGERSRSVLGQQLAHSDVGLIARHGEECVSDLRYLLGHSLDDGLVRVTDSHDANATSEIDELVAIDIHHKGVVGVVNIDGEGGRDASRYCCNAPGVEFLGCGAWNFSDNSP